MTTRNRNSNVKNTPATVEAVKEVTPEIVEVTTPEIVEVIKQEVVIVPHETPEPMKDFSTITEKEVLTTIDHQAIDNITISICGRQLAVNAQIMQELLTLGITRKFSTNLAKETDTIAKHKAALELIDLLESGHWTIRDKKAAEKPITIAATGGKGKGNSTIPAIGRFELIGMMRDLAETEKEITQTNLFNLFEETKFNAVVSARMADKNPTSLVYRAILELQAQAVKAAKKAQAIEAEKTAQLLEELDTL